MDDAPTRLRRGVGPYGNQLGGDVARRPRAGVDMGNVGINLGYDCTEPVGTPPEE